jgi:integrase
MSNSKTKSPLYLPDGRVVYFWKRSDTPFIYFSLDGGKKWQSTKERTKKAARESILHQLGYGPNQTNISSGPTLRKYVKEAWNEHIEAKAKRGKALSGKYIKESLAYIDKYVLDDPIANLPIRSIKVGHLEDFQSRLMDIKVDVSGVINYRTINRILGSLRPVFRRAEERDLIDKNPYKPFSFLDEKTKPQSIFTIEELNMLFPKDAWESGNFSPWKDEIDYTAFIVAASTGMRRGEIIAVTWKEIDLDNESIEIKQSWSREDGVGETKGQRPRSMPILDTLIWSDTRAVDALKNLQKQQRSHKIAVLNNPVFGYPDGTLHKETWWNKHFNNALKYAGIDKYMYCPDNQPLIPHSFRATLASCAEGILSDEQIQEFFGWTSYRMQQHYTHIGPDQARRIKERVAKSMGW